MRYRLDVDKACSTMVKLPLILLRLKVFQMMHDAHARRQSAIIVSTILILQSSVILGNTIWQAANWNASG